MGTAADKKELLLIIGGAGELGAATVVAAAGGNGGEGEREVVATYHRTLPPAFCMPHARRWRQLDCGDHEATRRLLLEETPTAVIYCAVPKHGGAASVAADDVHRGIVDDVVAAAEAANLLSARFVAVSTDQVFDGRRAAGERYHESDALAPTNPYATYKADMERRLGELAGAIVVARTSLILSLEPTEGKAVSFVLRCLRGENGDGVALYTDELRNMSFADDIGAALVELASPRCSLRSGVVHVVADEVSNRFELARLLAPRYRLDLRAVKPGLSASSGLNRPLNLALDTTTLRGTLRHARLRGITERLSAP